MTIDNTTLLLNFNDNFLQETKFSITMANMPYLSYFTNDLVLPGVSTNYATISTPYSDVKLAGDKLMYDELNFTFLLDEDLKVYEETYNWICGVTYPQNDTQYANQKKTGIYHDAIVTFNTNNNLENIKLTFKNCSPISLSGVNMTFTGNAERALTAELVLSYDNYTFSRVSN